MGTPLLPLSRKIERKTLNSRQCIEDAPLPASPYTARLSDMLRCRYLSEQENIYFDATLRAIQVKQRSIVGSFLERKALLA